MGVAGAFVRRSLLNMVKAVSKQPSECHVVRMSDEWHVGAFEGPSTYGALRTHYEDVFLNA